ncbi:hypothetical protein BGW80DRAFT_1373360 [Lactifluus volemus]|nr:hypothetical protein BGW80DRAFT_1373360 [Lactifluus volemus]
MSSQKSGLGPLLIGLVFSSMLYGVICLQVYLYFTRHSGKDKPFLKFFVCGIVHLFLVNAYYLLVTTNINVTDLKHSPWAIQVQTLFAVILSTTTQHTGMGNIGRIYIPIFIVILPLHIYIVQCFQYRIGSFPLAISLFSALFSLEFACNVIITSSTAYYLVVRGTRVKRSKASPARTIALYCMNSGLLIAFVVCLSSGLTCRDFPRRVFAALSLVTYARYPGDTVYAPFFFILERLYSCSFMAILNSRDHLRNAFHADTAFATFSVAPNQHLESTPPLQKMSTPRSTEDGWLSDGRLDSATIGHEDKQLQLPSNPLPTGDQPAAIAPIPPSLNHSSSLPPDHV